MLNATVVYQHPGLPQTQRLLPSGGLDVAGTFKKKQHQYQYKKYVSGE